MKLCDTCIYRNNVEQLKPCIIYRDDCEYYEKERGDMTDDLISRQVVLDAIRRISLGQTDAVKVSMMTEEYVKALPSVNPQEPKTRLGDILIADQCECENCIHEEMCKWKEERHGQECAYMETQKVRTK